MSAAASNPAGAQQQELGIGMFENHGSARLEAPWWPPGTQPRCHHGAPAWSRSRVGIEKVGAGGRCGRRRTMCCRRWRTWGWRPPACRAARPFWTASWRRRWGDCLGDAREGPSTSPPCPPPGRWPPSRPPPPPPPWAWLPPRPACLRPPGPSVRARAWDSCSYRSILHGPCARSRLHSTHKVAAGLRSVPQLSQGWSLLASGGPPSGICRRM